MLFRSGNGWSYEYARRQWDLVDNPNLDYHYLGDFDSAMIHLLTSVDNFERSEIIEIWHDDSDQILAFRRKRMIFVFNFHPVRSFTDYGFLVPEGDYDVVLNTDSRAFGGFGFADDTVRHFTVPDPLYKHQRKG